MTERDQILKRGFDVIGSVIGLIVLWPLILSTWICARLDTGASGFFLQERVGRDAKLFHVIKLRTMLPISGTNITTNLDPRITKLGAVFRRFKIDELPQLWNVLEGNMSFVGPRPDVVGFLDELEGSDRALLKLRPGLTGPASLKFYKEEEILASVANPECYNREVIWPEKVAINLDYLQNWSFGQDIRYILRTLVNGLF